MDLPCGPADHRTPTPAMAGEVVKVITLNVKGLNNPIKRRAILSYLENAQADVCLLQETHLLSKDWHRMCSRAFPQQFFSSTREKKAGVAILIAKLCRGLVKEKVTEIRGRLLAYTIQFGAQTMVLVSV